MPPQAVIHREGYGDDAIQTSGPRKQSPPYPHTARINRPGVESTTDYIEKGRGRKRGRKKVSKDREIEGELEMR